MSEALCPIGDGAHKRKPWASGPRDGPPRSGFACERCHKTWEWRNRVLVEAWADKP